MNKKRVRLITVTLLAVAASLPLAVYGTASATPALSATAAPAGKPATVNLPMVSCPTSFGIKAPPPVALPASRPVAVPRALAGRLSVYTDSEEKMELVAPRGWSCVAFYGADGSGGVAVYPRGEKLKKSWTQSWPLARTSAVSAVIGLETSACYACTISQACRLFPAANAAMRSYGGCPARPAAEKVTRIGAGLAGFADPPGTKGDGVPSGGRYPAQGVLTYHPRSADGSWLETCTLPGAGQAECTAILSRFVSWYGQR